MRAAAENEAPAGGAAQGLRESLAVDSADSAFVDGERKRLATLQAEFALRGYSLQPLEAGGLLAQRWGYCKDLADLDHAAQFLAQIGGR